MRHKSVGFRLLLALLISYRVLLTQADAQSFDFALDSLRVDGNLATSFFDDFNDGSLTSFPTSAFTCYQNSVQTESGSFLRLMSADGANTLTPGVLVDNCVLGLDPANTTWRLRDGFGNSVMTASFRADTPLANQAYGFQIFTLGTNELVNIQVGASGSGAAVNALAGPGPPVGSLSVNLNGVARILLRLIFNDSTNIVSHSFSIDGGTTFTTIPVSTAGTVMTSGSEAVVSVFGSVAFNQIIQLTDTAPGGPSVTPVGISRDGSRIVYLQGGVNSPGGGQLWSVNSDRSFPMQMTPSSLNVVHGHFGGTKAVFVACQSPCGWDNLSGHPGDVYVVNADGTGLTQITTDGAGPTSYEVARISGDGTKVAYLKQVTAVGFFELTLFIADADGTNTQPLAVPANSGLLSPGFVLNSDGSKLEFVYTSQGINRIALLNTDGTGFHDVVNYLGGSLALSGDGSTLAYGTETGLAIIKTDGTGQMELDSIPFGDPTISHDGTAVCYTGLVGFQHTDIFCIRSDGTDRRNVSNTPAVSGAFAQYSFVSANGAVVTFQSNTDLDPGRNTDGTFEVFAARLIPLLGPFSTNDAFTLRFFDVDDILSAYITNSEFTNQLVLTVTFPNATSDVNISNFIRPGTNTIRLELINTSPGQGWTYGYDFKVNGASKDSGQCGVFNTFGCQNDDQTQGIVWTHNIVFEVRSGSGPPPTITSISPDSGPTTGGPQVTITGTGFVDGATVTFGGSPATGVNVANANTIMAVTPAHAAGPVDVVVTNPDGQNATLAGGFNYFVPCSYTIDPLSQNFGALGGTGTVVVRAPNGCTWSSLSNVAWATITTGSVGSGNGTVTYKIEANTTFSARTGTFVVAGQTFTLDQARGVTLYYFALGDSVASGHGLMDDGNPCRRSTLAYPAKLSHRLASRYAGISFVSYACSGATTTMPGALEDPNQWFTNQVNNVLANLPADPTEPVLVSITVGANDLGWSKPSQFFNLLYRMKSKAFENFVHEKVENVRQALVSQIPRLLSFNNIAVAITDYHNPLNTDSVFFVGPGNGCGLVTDCYDRSEIAIHLLGGAIIQSYLDLGQPTRLQVTAVHGQFHGHEGAKPKCGNNPPSAANSWVQVTDCIHPNVVGADRYAEAVDLDAQRLSR